MITAEEFLIEKGYISKNHKFDREIGFLIEFAKLHVKAALIEASENATTLYSEEFILGEVYNVDKNSILHAYPLENIK